MGGAWWSWTQACGDPHPVRDGNTHQPQGNLNRIDCPSGESLGLVEGFAVPLSRAYPRAAPGTLTKVSRDGFTGSGTGRVEAWYPGTGRPQLETTNLTDVRLDPIEGGWQLIGRADGDYAVKAT